MNEKLAFKKLNKLFFTVKRMKTSVSKNEQGITPREKKYIMEQMTTLAAWL